MDSTKRKHDSPRDKTGTPRILQSKGNPMSKFFDDGLEDIGWLAAAMLALIFLTMACASFLVWAGVMV